MPGNSPIGADSRGDRGAHRRGRGTGHRGAGRATGVYRIASQDRPLGGEETGISLGDLVGADDPRLQTVVDRAALRPLISTLDERDRQILMPRFFQGSASARSRPAWATPRCTPPGC